MKRPLLFVVLFGLLAGFSAQAQLIVLRGTCSGVLKGGNVTLPMRHKAILIYEYNDELVAMILYGKIAGEKGAILRAATLDPPECPTLMEFNTWTLALESDGKGPVMHNVFHFLTGIDTGEFEAYECTMCFLSGPLKELNLFYPDGVDNFQLLPKKLKGCCFANLVDGGAWAGGWLKCNFRYNKKWTRFVNSDPEADIDGDIEPAVAFFLAYLLERGYPLVGEPAD